MKYLIINKSDLTIKEVGNIINHITESSEPITIYYGKKDKIILKHLDDVKDYIVEIEYLKSYTKWIITETKPTYNNKEN